MSNNFGDLTKLGAKKFKSFMCLLFILFTHGEALAFSQGVEKSVKGYLAEAKRMKDTGDYERAVLYLDSAFNKAREFKDIRGLIEVETQQGLIFHIKGNYNSALRSYFNALELCESQKSPSPEQMSELLNNIGSIHHYLKNFQEAERYYERSLEWMVQEGNKGNLGRSYNNFGSLYEDMRVVDKALAKHYLALEIWEELEDTSWMVISYSNIGACLELMGELDSAMTLYQRSFEMLKTLPPSLKTGIIMHRIGNLHLSKGEDGQAVIWCEKALAESRKWHSVPIIEISCLCLYQAHEKLGNEKEALAMYKEHILYRDSVSGADLTRQSTQIQLDYEFRKQQLADSLHTAEERMKAKFDFDATLAKEKTKRSLSYIIGFIVLMLAGGLWSRLNYIRKSRTIIQSERDKSDSLLLNILPASVAKELKTTGKAQARHFERVTVLFTDFKEFTNFAEHYTAQELLEELNICFKTFDQIILDHGLEKIKTIGDAYMAVGGLEDSSIDSAMDAVRAGLALQSFIKARKKIREADGQRAFDMRVGIHTGPVVAGVVGQSKFQYDIWGDTVNIASRMEYHCETGKVNISTATHGLIEHVKDFQFEARAPVQVKGKGKMNMYFVRHSGDHSSSDFLSRTQSM